MIREDREFLAEMAKLNTDMPSLALRIMEGSATASEQRYYADRLIAAGERLRWRAETVSGTLGAGVVVDGSVIDGQLVEEQVVVRSEASGTDREEQAGSERSLALPSHTVEPDWKPRKDLVWWEVLNSVGSAMELEKMRGWVVGM